MNDEERQFVNLLKEFTEESYNTINTTKWSNDLKKIIFVSDNSNKSLEYINFPDTIEELCINNYFGKLNTIKLPAKLKVLIFEKFCNQKLDDVNLPDSIEILKFASEYNQPLDNVKLPKSLKEIYFGEHYDKPLNNVKFPDNTIINPYDESLVENLPDNIYHVNVMCLLNPVKNLSLNLKSFSFVYDNDNNYEKSKFPFGCEVFRISFSNRILLYKN